MAIPHASIARLSSFMMLLDPDPAGEITASLSRDKCRDRGMGDVVRRNVDGSGSVAAIPVALLRSKCKCCGGASVVSDLSYQ